MSMIQAPNHPSMASRQSVASSSAVAFDPWLIWVAFRRSWWWATPLGIILGLIGGYVVFASFVPEYQASHLLEANRDYVVFQSVMQGPVELVKNEKPLIENHLVLSSVLSDPEVCKAPSLKDPSLRELNIRKNMTISDAGSKTLLRISYKDSDPEAAANVCNAIARSYLAQRQRFDDRRLETLESWLAQPTKSWENEVETQRKRVADLSKQAKGVDPFRDSGKSRENMDNLVRLREELTTIKSDEAVLEAEMGMLRSSIDAKQPSVVGQLDLLEVEEAITAHPSSMKIMKAIQEKQSDIRDMERNGYVAIRRGVYDELVADVKKLESELETTREAVRPAIEERLKQIRLEQYSAKAGEQLAAKQVELTKIKARRQIAESAFEQEEKRVSKFVGDTLDLYFAQQDFEQAKSMLTKLKDRVASLKTEQYKSSSIQSLAAAVAPSAPIESIPWKKIFMLAVATFAMPFGLALLWELKTRRVTSAQVLESGRSVPVLGEVARLPSSNAASKQQRVYEESVESVRANLMFSKEIDAMRTFVVASSMSGEGKSSLASHLALSLARSTGETVLLVDADMRSPDQHHLFGIDLGKGLAGVLAGTTTLDSAIDKSLGDRLHILPAGKLEGNPHRLASKDRVESLLSQAKSKYRFVVVDTAPVLAASETLAFSSLADATMVCVMRDTSRQDHLRRCLNRLEAAGSNVVGTVFNGVSTAQYYYRYGDYRYTFPQSTKS